MSLTRPSPRMLTDTPWTLKTIADLEALDTAGLPDGQQVSVSDQAPGGVYTYNAGASSGGIAPDAGVGRWLLTRANVQGRQYTTRAAFVSDVAAGYAPAEGTVVSAGGVQYVASAGATAVPGLAGWLPFGSWETGHFDVIGDGASDAAGKINAALDAAETAGVSVVNISAGVYILEDAIFIPAQVHLRGCDQNEVVLMRKSGTSGFHNVMIAGTSEAPNVGAKISGVTIDGNRSEVTGGHGIRVSNSLHWTVQNVTIKNTYDYGIGAQAGAVGGHLIENVTIISAGNDGIDFKNTGPQPSVRGTIRNLIVRDWSARVNDKPALDLRGPHDVINVRVLMTVDRNAVGIRLREDSVTNGPAGDDCFLSDIELRTTAASNQAIAVNSARVTFSGVRSVGPWSRSVIIGSDGTDNTVSDVYSEGANIAFEDAGLDTRWIVARAKDPTNECFRINGAVSSQFIACEADGGTYGFREFAAILQKHKFIGSRAVNASIANWSLRGDSTLIAPGNFTGDLSLRDGREQIWANVQQFDGLTGSFRFIPQANIIRADGTGDDADLRLQGKGTGTVRFGDGAAASVPADFSADNYLTIKLDNGSVIRIPYMTLSW